MGGVEQLGILYSGVSDRGEADLPRYIHPDYSEFFPSRYISKWRSFVSNPFSNPTCVELVLIFCVRRGAAEVKTLRYMEDQVPQE